ncbi:single-stranded DNA-binding protein [Actinacidiphila paucisporea]|uniref:Single-stranded DNA-binding protein n=1 Tax=Actinacidiphila paucisporea TaxID=310782 RepID=A0A1M6TFL8_9ACTN|nr:single-stranded DNA-binding protein [Actinacidiphila paucisporea]SHK55674.1 single-strand DNA-binding protein [Actinacidiphila paucisporea]
MAIGETVITLVGNITADPELRHTDEGIPWVTFNVASNSKVWDKNRSEWGEGKTLFMRCTAWRWLADNANSTLTKGARVIVTGALRQFEYTSADGIQRTGFGLDVEDIAVSLRYATATIHRTTSSATGGGESSSGRGQQVKGRGSAPGDDPWATAGNARSGGGWSDEPPF